MVIFRRIRGRIIPILKKAVDDHPTAAGVALVTGATIAANKVRKTAAEKTQGKGKQSFGMLTNFAVELGASAAILSAIAAKSPRAERSLRAFGGMLKRSFKGF